MPWPSDERLEAEVDGRVHSTERQSRNEQTKTEGAAIGATYLVCGAPRLASPWRRQYAHVLVDQLRFASNDAVVERKRKLQAEK